jgi:hypothetical protein
MTTMGRRRGDDDEDDDVVDWGWWSTAFSFPALSLLLVNGAASDGHVVGEKMMVDGWRPSRNEQHNGISTLFEHLLPRKE